MARLPTDIKNQTAKIKKNEGQSLIELLIGITVGGILIGSAAILLTLALKVSSQNKFIQTASFLSQDLMEKVTVFAEAKWYCPLENCGIYNLDRNKKYTLVSTPFQWNDVTSSEGEDIAYDNVSYKRYFSVRKACRNAGGAITGVTGSSGSCLVDSVEDPSTQQATVITSWTDQGGGSVKIVKFLTRHANRVAVQTDWSGGPTTPLNPVVNALSNTVSFYEVTIDGGASQIDYTLEPGCIKLNGASNLCVSP